MKANTKGSAFFHIKQLFSVLLCAVLMAAMLPVSVSAETEKSGKVVTVGWHEPPYFIKDGTGRMSGYSYEYLRKVAAYTGWEYKYVEGSWSDLLEMLKEGKIDLMSNVSYSEERSKSMLYSSIPMGTESYYVFVSPDNGEITADNVSSLNGKRVGVTKNSIQKDYFIAWAERLGISYQIVDASGTDEESISRLGKDYDAFVSIDVYASPDKAVPVFKVGSSDFYFAVSKNNPEILSGLDSALNSIQDENKYYDQQLHDKYLKTSGTNPYLNTSEKKWLSDHGKIRIGYQDSYLAFCAKDPETGELTGALKDYLDFAATVFENGKPEIETVAYGSASDALNALNAGEIDCMFPANLTDFDAEKMNVVMSPPLMATEMVAVVRSSEQKEFLHQEKIVVAVNEGNTNYELFLSDHYPSWERAYFKDTPSGLDAVADKTADCVIISSYRYSNISKQCEKLHLSTVNTGVSMNYCFAVREGDTELYSILAKITNLVPEAAVHTALTYYSTEDAKTSFWDIIGDNIFIVTTVIASVLLIIVLLLLRNIRADIKAEEKAKEHRRIADDLNRRVYVDALTSVRNKGGYTDYVRLLQERLRSGEITEFAVCGFDCDDLKYINDTYGHEKGDEYLKAAARLICRIFRNSPVFRVGGDEFIAILQNEDYDNRDILIRQFKDESSAINSSTENEWEHVNVSLGMAEYDPQIDSSVEDTAKRADERMYDNKRKRKAGREFRQPGTV